MAAGVSDERVFSKAPAGRRRWRHSISSRVKSLINHRQQGITRVPMMLTLLFLAASFTTSKVVTSSYKIRAKVTAAAGAAAKKFASWDLISGRTSETGLENGLKTLALPTRRLGSARFGSRTERAPSTSHASPFLLLLTSSLRPFGAR